MEVAPGARAPINGDALRLALGGLTHIRRLREQLGAWFAGMGWVPQSGSYEKKREIRKEPRVTMERSMKLSADVFGATEGWVIWRPQVIAPGRALGRWPEGRRSGVTSGGDPPRSGLLERPAQSPPRGPRRE